MNLGLNTLGSGASGLSLVRILGSLSRTMGIVKQFAPLYKEVKPLLAKAPAFFQNLNSIRNTLYNMRVTGGEIASDIPSSNVKVGSSNSPVFFQ